MNIYKISRCAFLCLLSCLLADAYAETTAGGKWNSSQNRPESAVNSSAENSDGGEKRKGDFQRDVVGDRPRPESDFTLTLNVLEKPNNPPEKNTDKSTDGAFRVLGANVQGHTPGGLYANEVKTFAYEFSYSKRILDPFYLEFFYLNEGHYKSYIWNDQGERILIWSEHHARDGIPGIKGWFYYPVFGGRVTLGAGSGAYVYFETNYEYENVGHYRNDHGVNLIASASVDVNLGKRFFIETRYNHVFGLKTYSSDGILFGMGYRTKSMDFDKERKFTGIKDVYDNDHAYFLGSLYGVGAIGSNNSHKMQHAFHLFFQQNLNAHFQYCISYIHEGRSPWLDRQGVAAEIALAENVGKRVRLSVGAGGYLNYRSETRDFYTSGFSLLPIFSLTGDMRLNSWMSLRLEMKRIYASHSQTDQFMTGLVFRIAGKKVNLIQSSK